MYQDLREIPTGLPPAGPLNRGGVRKCRNFRPITCYISETVEDRWIIQRGVLQALNSLSIHVTFTTIVPGAYTGEAKMYSVYCVNAIFAD